MKASQQKSQTTPMSNQSVKKMGVFQRKKKIQVLMTLKMIVIKKKRILQIAK